MVRTPSLLVLAALFAASLSACTTMSDDPRSRTPGKVMDDQGLEIEIFNDIRGADPGFGSADVKVVSYNGIVLLAGQVPDESLKQIAEDRAKQYDSVRAVHNELEIMQPLSFVERTNDTMLTTKIKGRMLADAEIVAGKIKVVTVNSTVFLMGMLPREEGDRAVAIARSVYGVQKIVKVFEYVDAAPAGTAPPVKPATRSPPGDPPAGSSTEGDPLPPVAPGTPY
jgi:osmotically-inducible protein OsmY